MFILLHVSFSFFNVLEPVILDGEGEYNLNNLMEIAVTDSYLGLDQKIREGKVIKK